MTERQGPYEADQWEDLTIWEDGYAHGYEDGSADVWASLEDDDDG